MGRSRRRRRARLGWALAAACWLAGSWAQSAGPQDRAAAESLFQAGKRMLAAGKVADACRKFEESQRLDPQGGTLLALGMCHEKEGKLATAWVEYREAGAAAKAANRPDRAAIANKAAAAIEPRLPACR